MELITLFHLKKISIEWENVFISNKCERELSILSPIINKKAKTNEEKIILIAKLKNADLKSDCITKSLNTLFELYNK